MSYVINKVMWCVKRLCVVSICVCILLCVYVYVMFNVVCVVFSVLCVVVPGETGVVTAGMRSSAVARARPGTPAQGRHQSSHTSMYNWWWQSLLCRWRVDIEYPTSYVLRLRVFTVHFFSKVLTMQSMIGVINQSRKLPAAAARCWVPGPLRAAIHFCSGKKPITWNIFRHGFSR